jgi:hypothetical protein
MPTANVSASTVGLALDNFDFAFTLLLHSGSLRELEHANRTTIQAIQRGIKSSSGIHKESVTVLGGLFSGMELVKSSGAMK